MRIAVPVTWRTEECLILSQSYHEIHELPIGYYTAISLVLLRKDRTDRMQMNVDEWRFSAIFITSHRNTAPKGLFLGEILGESQEHTPVGASPMHAFPGRRFGLRSKMPEHQTQSSAKQCKSKSERRVWASLWYYIASSTSICFYAKCARRFLFVDLVLVRT